MLMDRPGVATEIQTRRPIKTIYAHLLSSMLAVENG